MPVTGYCMKCKSKREITNPKEIVMKNGRSAVSGHCSICPNKTKMFKIGSMK